jgi:alkaline phosphatase D
MADDDGPKTTRRELLGAVAILATGVGLGCDAATGVPDGGGGGLDASARPDAGRGSDGGSSDAGTADAGAADAGPPDAGVPPAPPPEETPEALVATFPLGVSSGDATHEAAIFWTQYAGARELELVVWEMEGASYGRTVTQELVTLAEGGYVHVDVSGLRAGARHRYAFFERERVRTMRSPIGRLRAALDPEGVEPMVLGACSCTSNSRTADTLSRAGAREDLDVFLVLGDTTYNDGAETATEYRDKWRESLARPGYRAVRAASSLLCTWDDHELDNDLDPERMPAAQQAAARQTYFEHQPVRRDAAFPDRIWKSMRWGLTAEIFLLDCRSERRPSTRGGSSPEYVSRAQLDWLKTALLESRATFKIIMNSVPIADFPGAFDLARNDRWEGYGAQRTEILEHIEREAIRGVVARSSTSRRRGTTTP